MRRTTETQVFYNGAIKNYVLNGREILALNLDQAIRPTVDYYGDKNLRYQSMTDEIAGEEEKYAYRLLATDSSLKVYQLHLELDPSEPFDYFSTFTALLKNGYLGTTEVYWNGFPDSDKDPRSRMRMMWAMVEDPANFEQSVDIR